jgi:hypothetical protein
MKQKDSLRYSLPGKPISAEEFRTWAKSAEKTGTISLQEAKKVWAVKRKKLLRISKKMN